MADYNVKVGSTASVIDATLLDANGAAVLIQGASVAFVARPIASSTPSINASATNLDDGTTANKGKVRYAFVSADLTVAGLYLFEWKVSFAGPKPLRWPEDGWYLLEIEPAIA